MRSLILAVAVLAIACSASAAPLNCGKDQQPCGKVCIAKDKVCHATPVKAPNCAPGHALCNGTCLPAGKVCHMHFR